MKPKILFVSTARSIGGGETYLANLLPLLSETCDCTVMATGPILKLIKESAQSRRLIPFPRSVQKFIRRHYKLKKLYYRFYLNIFLRAHRYDVVNLQEFDGAFVENISFRPKVVTLHTRFIVADNLKGWISSCFEGIAKVICVSEQTRDDVLNVGVPADKCLVLHNGVDTDKFKPFPTAGEYITWIGRLEQVDKNPMLFIKIAEAAQAHRYDYKFRLVGRGSALKAIKKYIHEHRIKNIELVDFQDPVGMQRIYSEAKVVCLTSYSEGLPFVALEAMACGRPVVSTDVGGLGEIIKTSSEGILIAKPDEWLFLEALNKLQDKNLYEAMSRAARTRILADFSLNENARQTAELYKQLIKVEH